MRILLINYEYPHQPDCGGGGRVTELLANGLRDRGHAVRIVTDDAHREATVRGPDGGHWATFPWRSRKAA